MMTNTVLIALLVVLIVLVGARWLRRRDTAQQGPDDRLDTLAAWPPQATRILGTHERLAYLILIRALPEHIILAKVPLARFLRVPKRHSHAEWLRRLGNQCVDLVVCDGASQVVAVVDVQSPAAQTNDRARRRSLRIARSLKAAEVPLHVWTEGALPSLEAVRATIAPRPAMSIEAGQTTSGVTRSKPGTTPFDDSQRDSTHDEHIEVIEPPPSTWYDDLDSGPTPLQQKAPPRR